MSTETPGGGPQGPKGPSSQPVPGLTQEQIDAFEQDLDRMLFAPPIEAAPDDGIATRPIPAQKQKGWIRMKVQRPTPQPPAPQPPPRTKDEERLAAFANLSEDELRDLQGKIDAVPFPEKFDVLLTNGPKGEKMLYVDEETNIVLALQYLQASRDAGDPVTVDVRAVQRAIDAQSKRMCVHLGDRAQNKIKASYESLQKNARAADMVASERLRFVDDLLHGGDETLRQFLEFQTPA